ncbi:MAG: chromosomal replication initiator protein DnaA [Calothrix sp. SM1_5_4]|nr:chromosomal replication initiator protein DnaA [Calothrix sp. SM1_5_4]
MLPTFPLIHIFKLRAHEVSSLQHPHQEFWLQIKNSLKAKNQNNKPLQMWFEPTNLVGVEDRQSGRCFMLGVPTELHKFWISQNLLERICSEISALYQNPFQIELVVTAQGAATLPDHSTLPLEIATQNAAATPAYTPSEDSGVSAGAFGSHRDMLNADYTFSTFVVGRNNEFAHAASFSIAESPGKENYNPLFICGPTGMGKTHLLNAVGNHIRQNFPHLRILYVSAERFLNECISSIRRNEMDRFRLRYRDQCDVLLMDDIQILGRGEAVQEEFFHTLNDFFEKDQQVIVASDRMPKDIKGLEDRIRTRLEWGLIADIQMPDIETRVAILKYKAERKNIMLPNEVIGHVARISKRSIRELEGNLNKIKMFSELQGLPIDLELAKRVLSTHDDVATITIDDIQKLVSDHYKVRMPDLKSKTRTKPLVVARQVAMYLVKKHLDKSLVDIGRSFGGKDHTTVMNALRRIEDQLNKDSEIKRDIEELEGRIHNITGV